MISHVRVDWSYYIMTVRAPKHGFPHLEVDGCHVPNFPGHWDTTEGHVGEMPQSLHSLKKHTVFVLRVEHLHQ